VPRRLNVPEMLSWTQQPARAWLESTSTVTASREQDATQYSEKVLETDDPCSGGSVPLREVEKMFLAMQGRVRVSAKWLHMTVCSGKILQFILALHNLLL
jgi:hypothetical protein